MFRIYVWGRTGPHMTPSTVSRWPSQLMSRYLAVENECYLPVRAPRLIGDSVDEELEKREGDQSLQELRRQLCSQSRRSIAQLEKVSSPQFPKLRPTPETAAAAERTHVQDTIDATAAVLPH